MEEDYRKMKQEKERLYLEERSLVDMALKLISLPNIICCSGTDILSRSREEAGQYYIQKGYLFRLQEYEKVGNSSWSLQRPKRTNICILWLWENQENVLVFRFILSLKTMHLPRLKEMQTSKLTTIMDKSPWDSQNVTSILCVSQVLSQKAVLSFYKSMSPPPSPPNTMLKDQRNCALTVSTLSVGWGEGVGTKSVSSARIQFRVC